MTRNRLGTAIGPVRSLNQVSHSLEPVWEGPKMKLDIHNHYFPPRYLRSLHLDTVSFYAPALLCALAFSGPNRLVLGSDYRHVIGDLNRAIAAIEGLNIPQEHKEAIFGANVEALLRIA
jgi:predicted TIM-barrel fold metal-dependent hydrolase